MDMRDRIRCKFRWKDMHGGIARFKRYLAGASAKGKKNSIKCKKVTEADSKEMLEFMKAYAAKHNVIMRMQQQLMMMMVMKKKKKKKKKRMQH
jgi:hypothetical protein